MTRPAVYNIAAGQSFIDVLARGMWEKAGQDPLRLSETRVLLPTRRACRNLQDAFLRLTGGAAVLLPQMTPLGDVDEEALLFFTADTEDAARLADIPPAISRLRRQILLARAIEKKPDMVESFDQAIGLAAELGHFLDEVENESLDFESLKNLVPDQGQLAAHWQITLQFLDVLTEVWPGILKTRNVIDYAARRRQLIEAQARLWQKNPPDFPVIAAGDRGSLPATAQLLAVVAGLPNGEVVLPGLDTEIDADSWQEITEDHPQYDLKKLTATLGVAREDVVHWPVDARNSTARARSDLAREMMRPAQTSENWQEISHLKPEALDGLQLLDCATLQEEAETIALILRHVLETPQKTAALITPDRDLAGRVKTALARWGIAIDDSAGTPLRQTPVGAFLYLLADAMDQALAPVALLSVLKHPLAAGGTNRLKFLRQVQRFEKSALRGPRPASGFDGLRHDPSHQDFVGDLETRMGAFLTLFEAETMPFAAFLDAHIACAESLAATDQKSGIQRLWQGEAGETAARFINELRETADDIPDLNGRQYVHLLNALMKTPMVRTPRGLHPRLRILGQLESRLYNPDLVILGSVNEGSWPAVTASGPWMSRQMRRDFGLPVPEQPVGQDAHDFAMAFCAPETIITRARRVGGAPTVPARWLLRLQTVLTGAGLECPRGFDWIVLAQHLDRPGVADIQPCPRPHPVPPLALRPREVSVTDVEKWRRDPYAFYAKKILGLNALEDLDADPGAAERGQLLHKIFEIFVRENPDDLPDNAEEILIDIGKQIFAAENTAPETHAFWWQKFLNLAHGFIAEEKTWRTHVARPLAQEEQGRTVIPVPGGDFVLRARADRIDVKSDGSLVVIDYKTGTVPSGIDVKTGLSPQLPLEALIAEDKKDGFENVPAAPVDSVYYWRITGGRPPIEKTEISKLDLKSAAAGFAALVTRYDDVKTGYAARPRADKALKYSDYNHLARVQEWSLQGDVEDEA